MAEFAPFSTLIENRRIAPHANPYYNYTQVFTPRRLKDLFKWCEFLFYNSPQIYAALRKFGEYPITTITYDSTNAALKRQHKQLHEKVLRTREILIVATLDKYVYGNAFLSMYQPFVRYLKCPACKAQTNIQYINYKYSVKNLAFTYKCDHCNATVKSTVNDVIDKKLTFSRKVHFVRWDPKLMDIEHNNITGHSIYYYTIPAELTQRVNAGLKSAIDTLPLGFLQAIRSNKKFKFAPDALFHMKIGGPAGISPQWGLPPLLSVMSLFHYAAILRKANESIALDHLVPFRLVHPAPSSGNADPIMSLNMAKWQDNMQHQFKQWRIDPLHIMFAPIPVGMTQIGGQGRALLTLGEVQEAEKNIVAALGIPIEFIYGGLTGKGMEATLRLLENQLETHINDLLDLLQWVDDKASNFLGWEKLIVGMTKFRMIDDYTTRDAIFQMWAQGVQSGKQIISDSKIGELYDFDLKEESEKIKQETLNRIRDEQEMRHQVEALQNSMAEQARIEAQSGGPGPMGYNQTEILGRADQIVQQVVQADESTRRSMLHQLQTEDAVMYAVVVQRLEQQRTIEKQQAVAGSRGQ